MLVEFIVHDLQDMPVLAEPRLTTYVRDVGTKRVSRFLMHEMGRRCGGIWKVGVDNLTMHTHFRPCTLSCLFVNVKTCFVFCFTYVLKL